MSSHNYKTKLNFLTSIEESPQTEVSTSNDTTVNTSEVSETAILITNLEKR